jgi:MULE transposase domain
MDLSPMEQLYEDLGIALHNEHTWQCLPINILDDKENVMDIVPFIGNPLFQGLKHYLSSQFADDDLKTRKAVIHMVRHACADAGFHVVVHSWNGATMKLRFQCQRYRAYDSGKTKASHTEEEAIIKDTILDNEVAILTTDAEVSDVTQVADDTYTSTGSEKLHNRSRTKKALCNEDTCSCHFSLHFDSEAKRYYLKGGTGNATHIGHLYQKAVNIKNSSLFLNDEELQLLKDSVAVQMEPAAAQALMMKRNGVLIPAHAISYLKEKENRPMPKGVEARHISSADALLSYLKNRQDISYFAVYDDPSSSLITMPKKRLVKKTVVRINGISKETEEASDIDLQFAERAAAKRKELSLSNDTKILLMLAWNTDEERRIFSLFPELLVADLTEGTNNAQRSVALFVGKDSNNQTFTALRVFMPSHRQHAFQLCLAEAVPHLLTKKSLAQTEVAITDGEVMLYQPWDNLISQKQIYPKCTHSLCVYHLTSRGPLAKVTLGKVTPKGIAYMLVAKHWIHSWMMTIETVQEYKMSLSIFEKWLESSDVITTLGSLVIKEIREFMVASLLNHELKWLRAYKMGKRNFETYASSAAESENSVIKRSSMGPKPRHSIAAAAKAMTELNDRRITAKLQKVAAEVDKSTVNDSLFAALDDLTQYQAKAMIQDFKSRVVYALYRYDQYTFYVRKSKYTNKPGSYYDTNLNSFVNYMVPQFARTRVVKVVEDSNCLRRDPIYNLTCSCNWPRSDI